MHEDLRNAAGDRAKAIEFSLQGIDVCKECLTFAVGLLASGGSLFTLAGLLNSSAVRSSCFRARPTYRAVPRPVADHKRRSTV